MQQLSSFFPYCGLKYADLVTDQGVDPLINLICGGELSMFVVLFLVKFSYILEFVKIIPFLYTLQCPDETDDLMDCFSYVKHGAVLSGEHMTLMISHFLLLFQYIGCSSIILF